MQRLRDHAGRASILALEFYKRADLGDDVSVGALRGGRATPVATLRALPDELCRDHLADLAWTLAVRHPELEGQRVPVGIEVSDEQPILPLLVAKKPGPWVGAQVLATAPMHLETLDREALARILARRGLDPKGLVFVLHPVTPPRAENSETDADGFRLSSSGQCPARPGRWVTAEVPRLPELAHKPGAFVELSPACAAAFWTPVYVAAGLLESLVADEAEYARRAGDGWTERAWCLGGELGRHEGRPAAFVQAAWPVTQGEAQTARIVFGPQSWVTVRSEMERTGLGLLGWVHTHSLDRLKQEPGAELDSGLFLSDTDLDSARRLGFRAPATLTAVLDSDACARDPARPLEQQIAFWGWRFGFLTRRSVRVLCEGEAL